jgi:hypothetical protein
MRSRYIRKTSSVGVVTLVTCLVGLSPVPGSHAQMQPPSLDLDRASSQRSAIKHGNRVCNHKPYFRYVGGERDGYAAPADATYPSPNLAALSSGEPRRHYDQDLRDQIFGDSFNLQYDQFVCHAVLRIETMHSGDNPANDTMLLGHASSDGTFTTAARLDQPGSGSGVWHLSNESTRMLTDMTMSASTPEEAVLDVFVEDDTKVDYLMLWVWYLDPFTPS